MAFRAHVKLHSTGGERYKFTDHSENRSRLNDMRKSDEFCDVTVYAKNHHHSAHRNVLAAFSPVLRDVMTEGDSSIDLPVNPFILDDLLEYAYTSEIVISEDNAEPLLEAARRLQLPKLQAACSQYLKQNLDPTSCFRAYYLAESNGCPALQQEALMFIIRHFYILTDRDGWKKLPSSVFSRVLSHDLTLVENEGKLLVAAMKWFLHDRGSRRYDFENIVRLVRFECVSPAFIRNCVRSFVQEYPDYRNFITETLQPILYKDRVSIWEVEAVRPPRNQNVRKVVLILDTRSGYLQSYDPLMQQWGYLAPLPLGIFAQASHCTMTVSESNVVYVSVDSMDSLKKCRMFSYNPLKNAWTPIHSTLLFRKQPGLGMIRNWLYAIGGYNFDQSIRSVERYNPFRRKWESVCSLVEAVEEMTVLSNEGCLYAVGTQILPEEHLIIIQKYTPGTNSWVLLARKPGGRCRSACLLRRHIYLFGADGTSVEFFDIDREEWTSCPPMHDVRHAPGVAVFDGKLYTFGGWVPPGNNQGDRYFICSYMRSLWSSVRPTNFNRSIESYDEDTHSWKSRTGVSKLPDSFVKCATVYILEECKKTINNSGINFLSYNSFESLISDDSSSNEGNSN